MSCRQAPPVLEAVCGDLAVRGYTVTPLRALEILVWTEVEPNGYYRTPVARVP